MAERDAFLQTFRMEQLKKDDDFEKQKRSLKDKINELEQDVSFRKSQIE